MDIQRQIGAVYVLNSQESDFVKKMKELFDDCRPDAFYDAVTGPIGTKIFRAMPKYTTICMYGRLDCRGYDLDDDDMRRDEFLGKELRSFGVFDFTDTYPEYKEMFSENICRKLVDGGYKNEIQQQFGFKDFDEAFFVSKKNPTKGKVVFVNKKFEHGK